MNALQPFLIVDDNGRDVELTIQALSAYRLANEIVVLGDGVEALDYLHCRGAFEGRAKDNPALILLDLNMPRLGGLEVLRQIRDDPDLCSLRVVIMTASRHEGDLINSFSLGVNAYVVKPLQFHEFIEAVKRLEGSWMFFQKEPEHAPCAAT